MPTEKQNNPGSWRNKLDETGGGNAGAFDKNAAWEKLHNRMHQKPRHIKAAWYWSAAACLLILFFIRVAFFQKHEKQIAHTVPVKKDNQRSPVIAKIDRTGSATATIIPAKKPGKTNRAKEIKPAYSRNHDRQITVPKTGFSSQNTDPVITQILSDHHIPVVTLASLPTRKKMKVVHINDLDSPSEDLAISSSSNKAAKVLNSFFNKGHSQPGQGAVSNEYTGLIKIKISTQN